MLVFIASLNYDLRILILKLFVNKNIIKVGVDIGQNMTYVENIHSINNIYSLL